jgi:heme oxygenase (biliverdin-IX-beta and delta-forming)
MPLTQDTLSQVLKKETRLDHENAENVLFPFLNAMRTSDDYARLLKTFYGFFAPMELLIEQHLPAIHLPDISTRGNARHITADLEALGFETKSLLLCHTLPPIENTGEAFGALYVLEGSTLGGRMIRKMLLSHEHLHLNEEQVQFFNGYGEETASRWKLFQQSLDQQSEKTLIIRSAQLCFQSFGQWIKQVLYDKPDHAQ